MPPAPDPRSRDAREAMLEALCDTFVPAVDGDDAFLARTASALGVPAALAAAASDALLDML